MSAEVEERPHMNDLWKTSYEPMLTALIENVAMAYSPATTRQVDTLLVV